MFNNYQEFATLTSSIALCLSLPPPCLLPFLFPELFIGTQPSFYPYIPLKRSLKIINIFL